MSLIDEFPIKLNDSSAGALCMNELMQGFTGE